MTILLRPDADVVVVSIAVDEYATPTTDDEAGATQFESLPRIKDDVAALRRLFESDRYRAAGFQLLDPIRGGTAGSITDELTRIKKALAQRPSLAVILYWTGHGRTVQNELRLVTEECLDPISGSDGLAPGQVVGKLADAKLSMLYVLLDVCQAAAAGAELVTSAAKRSFSPDNPFGMSALFSAYPFENAQDGFFIDSLVRLMDEGPSAQALVEMTKQDWEAFNPKNRLLTLWEIEKALYLEIDVAKSKLPLLPSTYSVHLGDTQRRTFPNPKYLSSTQAVNVEEARRRSLSHVDADTHFLPKARGLEPGEEGWFFSGRRELSREIVRWLQQSGPVGAQGLFVLTGEGGTGKSAVLGRLVLLCDQRYRESARDTGWDESADEADATAPPLGAIDAALHLRKLTALQVVQALAELLELKLGKVPADVSSLVAAVAARPVTTRPITVVLDALDESNEPGPIAVTLIRPLVQKGWRILVATRRSVADRGIGDLIAMLGAAHVHNLDHELSTRADIAQYVQRRLAKTTGSPYAGLATLSAAISETIAHRAVGKFLYARIMAAALLRRPEPIDIDRIGEELAANLDDALERELQALDRDFQLHFERADAGATALFAALAWSEGEGLPLRDGVWSDLATAISEAQPSLTHEHATWLLREGGRFIVEAGDGEQAVYRLYHQSLSERFRARFSGAALISRLAQALEAQVEHAGGWTQSNPYVVRHLATHLAPLADDRRLQRLLLDFSWMSAKLRQDGIQSLLADYARCRSPNSPVRRLERVLAQSAHILALNPKQLASQLLARLVQAPESKLAPFLASVHAKARPPWLRPLTASLAGEQSTRWLRPAHGGTLSSVTLSPSGLWAAHVAGTNDVLVWDLKQWQALGPMFRAAHHPYALALSDDARSCLFSDSLGSVYRWSAINGEISGERAHGDISIASMLAISADGQFGLSATLWPPRELVAWDFVSDRREVVWDNSGHKIVALSLAPSGKSAAVACADGSVHLLDLWPVRDLGRFELGGRPLALARSRDDSVLVSTDTEGRIEMRRMGAPERPIAVFSTNEQPQSVALSADQGYIAIGTDRGTVELWNVVSRQRNVRYGYAHTYEVERIAFSDDGRHVVSADRLQIKEWDIEPAGGDTAEPSTVRAAGDVKVTGDATRAIAMLDNGRLGVWDLRTGVLQSALSSGSETGGTAKGIALAANASRVLAWYVDHLFVWDLDLGAIVASLPASQVEDAALTPDGTAVVYAEGIRVLLWRPDEKDGLVELGSCREGIRRLAISPDGQQALSSGLDRMVTLWSLDQPNQGTRNSMLNQYSPDARDKPSTIAFSGPRTAVVTSGDGSLFVLNTSNPRRIEGRRLPFVHGSRVNQILSTRDGSFAVTSSYDERIMVWDLTTHRRLAVFDAHWGHLQQLSASFSRVLLSTVDGILKLVSLQDGSLLMAFQGDKQITSCAADADLEWIAASDQSGQIHFLHAEDAA